MSHLILNHSFDSFLSVASAPHENPSSCLSIRGLESWAGVPTVEAVRLARQGWPEGFEKMKSVCQQLEHELTFAGVKEEIVRDVEGQAPDVDAYLRGDPECMFSIKQEYMERKVVQLQISLAVSANVPANDLFWRGAVAVAVLHNLEARGFSVKLMVDFSTSHDKLCSIILPAKDSGQPLDIDRLAFLIANPASFRRLAFSVWEHLPEKDRPEGTYNYGQGYGTPRSPKLPDTDLHLSLQLIRAYDVSSALENYKSLMSQLTAVLQVKAQKALEESW